MKESFENRKQRQPEIFRAYEKFVDSCIQRSFDNIPREEKTDIFESLIHAAEYVNYEFSNHEKDLDIVEFLLSQNIEEYNFTTPTVLSFQRTVLNLSNKLNVAILPENVFQQYLKPEHIDKEEEFKQILGSALEKMSNIKYVYSNPYFDDFMKIGVADFNFHLVKDYAPLEKDLANLRIEHMKYSREKGADRPLAIINQILDMQIESIRKGEKGFTFSITACEAMMNNVLVSKDIQDKSAIGFFAGLVTNKESLKDFQARYQEAFNNIVLARGKQGAATIIKQVAALRMQGLISGEKISFQINGKQILKTQQEAIESPEARNAMMDILENAEVILEKPLLMKPEYFAQLNKEKDVNHRRDINFIIARLAKGDKISKDAKKPLRQFVDMTLARIDQRHPSLFENHQGIKSKAEDEYYLIRLAKIVVKGLADQTDKETNQTRVTLSHKLEKLSEPTYEIQDLMLSLQSEVRRDFWRKSRSKKPNLDDIYGTNIKTPKNPSNDNKSNKGKGSR